MGRIWRWTAAVLVLGLFASAPAGAQSNTGTSLGSFLLIEPDARIAGMGNAGVASTSGLPSVYYNPAGIGLLSSYGVEFTHSDWLAGIAYHYAAVAVPAGKFGSLFASVTALNSGDIDVRTVDQPLGTGEKFTASDLAVSLGYGRLISDRFSAGFQVTYIQERIWHSSAGTGALSVGTLYRLADDGLRIGAAIQNFGARAGFSGRDLRIVYDSDPSKHGDNSQLPGTVFADKFPIPVLFRVGVGMPFKVSSDVRVDCEIDAFHPSENSESVGLGAELSVKKSLALRAGYQNLFQKDSEEGLTLGAGFKGSREDVQYHVEYAWADHGRLDHTSRFTLGVTF